MRLSAFLSLVVTGSAFTVVSAAADVAISGAPTQNMACSAGVCSPTAANAVLNVQDLANLLASGNATVTTTGSGVQASDIHLDAPLAWTAATGLTLDAFRSIKLNRMMTVDGPGAVSLRTNDGGSGGEFWCGDKGRLEFMSTSSGLTIDGTAYMLVNSVASLASAIAVNPSGAFALANSYDASRDGTYTTSPVATAFGGSFNGLGNTISNLSINDPTQNAYVGLFAQITAGSVISNIRLMNENVQGGSGSSQSSTEEIGGLAGYVAGAVVHSFSAGAISGGGYAAVGGLVGFSDGMITESMSSASTSTSSPGYSGGLVGGAGKGSINDSSASGTVTGFGYNGGLVGFDYGASITHSLASGAVSSGDGKTYVGGLAALDVYGAIDRSQASGTVACQYVCGGLVAALGLFGTGTPKISQSFATGSVTGTMLAGGLVGFNSMGQVANSYATGAVSANDVGGLVGQNENYSGYHSISQSYATGAITGTGGYVGGLIGFDDNHWHASTINRAYWDTTTSGITDPSEGAGNVANDLGIKGLTDSQLKSGLPKGFNPKIWGENSNINGGLPYLIANPPQS